MVRLNGVRSAAAERVSAFLRERMEASGDAVYDPDDVYISGDPDSISMESTSNSDGDDQSSSFPGIDFEKNRFNIDARLDNEERPEESSILLVISSTIRTIRELGNYLIASFQRDIWPKIDLNFVLGDPVLSNVTFIVLVLVFQNRLSTESILLIASFQYNINPIYAVLGVCAYIYLRPSQLPKQFIRLSKSKVDDNLRIARRNALLVGTSDPDASEREFDHVFIGYNIATLYCAALLSKCGHKCIVLPTKSGHRIQINPKGAPSPVPLIDPMVPRLEQFQGMLDLAAPIRGGRVLLRPLGTSASGYVHAVIHCRSARLTLQRDASSTRSSDSVASAEVVDSNPPSQPLHVVVDVPAIDFTLRAGHQSLNEDLVSRCGLTMPGAQRLTAPFAQACSLLSLLQSTKVRPFDWSYGMATSSATSSANKGSGNGDSAPPKNSLQVMEDLKQMHLFANRSVFGYLNDAVPGAVLQKSPTTAGRAVEPSSNGPTAQINVSPVERDCIRDVYDVLSGIASGLASSESCLDPTTEESAVSLAALLGPVPLSGGYAPSGGTEAIEHMLRCTIEEAGGRVLTPSRSAPDVVEILLEPMVTASESSRSSSNSNSRANANGILSTGLKAVGVRLSQIYGPNNDNSETKEVQVNSSKDECTPATLIKARRSVVSGVGLADTLASLTAASLRGEQNKDDSVSKYLDSVIKQREARPKILTIFWTKRRRCGFNACSCFIHMRSEDVAYIEVPRAIVLQTVGAVGPLRDKASPPTTHLGAVTTAFKVWSPSARHSQLDPEENKTDPRDPDTCVFLVETAAPMDLLTSDASSPLSYYLDPRKFAESSTPTSEAFSPSAFIERNSYCSIKSMKQRERFRSQALTALQRAHPCVVDCPPSGLCDDDATGGGEEPTATSSCGYDIKHCSIVATPPVPLPSLSSPESSRVATTAIESLFTCSVSDLSAGGGALPGFLQAGWTAANAILGYTQAELLAQRSVTSDLRAMALQS